MATSEVVRGKPTAKGGGNAALVAAGILLSRLVGLVRNRLFAHVLGAGAVADAWFTATQIPNVLQNLLGEGVLSASLIPVYAGLRAEGREEDARRVAGAVFGLLSMLVAVVVACGLWAAPLLVRVLAPGFDGEVRQTTIQLVSIIFPGTGVLVLSAWCLGILNSHKRFFLSYAAPVIWNGCIIAALAAVRGEGQAKAVEWAAWGFVAGSVAQFAVQLPAVLKLLGGLKAAPDWRLPGVRQVVRGFLPAVVARGVVQVSAWVDGAYATLISEGARSALSYAQTISMLPISLFGMAISAAELPDMSADAVKSAEERATALRGRLTAGLSRMSFFVVPSVVAFVLLGDLIAGVLLQSGRFGSAESRLAWYILLGSGVALTAQTSGRLYSAAFYALKDTRTPLKFAAMRVTVGVALGYYAVRILPGQLGLPANLGVVFITVTTGFTAWLEMLSLRRALRAHIGDIPRQGGQLARVWAAAVVAGVGTLGLKVALVDLFGAREVSEWGGSFLPPPNLPVLLTSTALLGVFGVVYLGLTLALGVTQSRALVQRFVRRRSS